MNEVDLVFLIMIIVVLSVVALIQFIFYVVQSLAWGKIVRALKPSEKNAWQIWVPFWRYYYISEILSMMPNSNCYLASSMLYWVGISLVGYILFTPLTTFAALVFFIFKFCKTYYLTEFVDGNMSPFHIFLTLLGLQCITDYVYANKIANNASDYATRVRETGMTFEDRLLFKQATQTKSDDVASSYANSVVTEEVTESTISLVKEVEPESDLGEQAGEETNFTAAKISSSDKNNFMGDAGTTTKLKLKK